MITKPTRKPYPPMWAGGEGRLEIHMATQPGDRLQALGNNNRFPGSTAEPPGCDNESTST